MISRLDKIENCRIILCDKKMHIMLKVWFNKVIIKLLCSKVLSFKGQNVHTMNVVNEYANMGLLVIWIR